jgi:UDP-N-acetylglucosamine acyltransferase
MSYPLTNIHPNAKIGANVTIEPFTTIYGDVEIGDGTWIGPNVTIMDGARIGKNCKIFPGAVVSGVPQDLKYRDEVTLTFVGDNTVVRECVTISRGTSDKMKTVVGRNCLLMAYVHVAHDCEVGDNCILANAVQVAGHVVIEDSVIVGGASAIHQFVRIGAHAIISGGSLVRQDVPPFVKAAREPLSYCGLNVVGLRRRGFNADTIARIKDTYAYLYLKGHNITNGMKAIEEETPASEERDIILNFVKGAKRGLIRSATAGSAVQDDD